MCCIGSQHRDVSARNLCASCAIGYQQTQLAVVIVVVVVVNAQTQIRAHKSQII